MDAIDKSMVRRGLILQALRAMLDGLSDVAIAGFLTAQGDNASKMEIRAELDYLAGKGNEYVEFTVRSHHQWRAKLTPAGVDLVDGIAPDDPGVVIAR